MAEIFVRTVGEDLPAATPQRTGGLTGARPASAFLLPGLLLRFVDIAAPLLRASTQARVGQIRCDQFMHQRLVVCASEICVGRGQLRFRLALIVDDRQFHYALTLTVGDTTTLPP